MAEFFGFTDASKVDANPIIDFSSVSKTIVDGLAKNEADRELQRKEDAKITQDNIEAVGNITYGSDQTFNEIMTKYGYNAKETMNDWYKQLTSGRMSRREFALRSQSLMNGTKSIADASKAWNENNKVYTDLLNSGEASAMAQYTAKKIADMQMLNNKSAVIDPTTGKVVWAAVDENNKIIPESIMDVNSIKNLRNNLEKKVNVPKEVNELAGTKIEDFKKSYGPYLDINDPKVRDEYKKLQKATADYILSTPTRMADVLVNFTGEGYYLTDNANDTNPLAVQVIRTSNGMTIPKPTPAQETAAIESINRAIDSQMPFERKQTAPAVRSSGGGGKGSGDEEKERVSAGETLTVRQTVTNPSTKTKTPIVGKQTAINMSPMPMAGVGYTVTVDAVGDAGLGVKYMVVSEYKGKSTRGFTEFSGDTKMETGSDSLKTKTTKTIYFEDPAKKNIPKRKGVSVVNPTEYTKLKTMLEERGIDVDGLTIGATPASAAKSKANRQPTRTTSQEDFDSRWRKLKPGQKLIGPDGETYTKGE